MSRLAIRLLGAPEFHMDDTPVGKFVTRKVQALLIFLVCTRRPHTRDGVAAMFWPDVGEEQAKSSLRRALSNLRDLLGAHLTIERREIAFDRRSDYWLDLEEFTAGVAALDRSERPNLAAAQLKTVESALDLYRGELLAGFHVADAPAFDEWVLYEREHLRTLALRGLHGLADHYIASGNVQAGLATTRRLLALEPWYEIGHHQQMLLLARSGDVTAALRQYELCHKLLAEEFGVAPSPETADLYARIKAGDFSPAGRSAQPESAEHPGSSHVGTSLAGAADLSDIPQTLAFVGREPELEQLRQVHLIDGCSVIALLGVGGVGKTSLAAHYTRSLLEDVRGAGAPLERVLWTSLLNAPPLDTVLRMWLRSLSGQRITHLPPTLDEQLALLLDYARQQRCLLVLDNLESILQSGHDAGRFQPGYESYELLIRRMAELSHRSSLLLTSREAPRAVVQLARSHGSVGTVTLGGLANADAAQLLAQSGLENDTLQLTDLVRRYSGNPLALKLAADTVRGLFGGDLAAFLGNEPPIFGDIRTVLDQQVSRLTDLERELLIWLAVEREPVAPDTLWENLASAPPRSVFLDAMLSLRHSSLVDLMAAANGKGVARLTLQNVVMEYATDSFLRRLHGELETGRLEWFRRHALVMARAREYVQESQRRLLLQPVADGMVRRWGKPGAHQRLRELLDQLRGADVPAPGYAAANILHLFLYLEADLRGADFARLPVRQADLRTASLPDVDLREADLTGSIFSDTFGLIYCVALSPDGRYGAAGGSDGTVYLWRTADYQPYRMLHGHGHLVSSLAFTEDGTVLASCGYDGLIRLWDVQTGELVRRLCHQDELANVNKLSIVAGHLAAVVADKLIQLWEWRRGELIYELRSSGSIHDMALSPDGRLLVSVGADPPLSLWDVATGRLLHTSRGSLGKLTSVAVSADGSTIATGGADNLIGLQHTGDMNARRVLAGHTDEILALAFSPDGKHLASGSADHTARVWELDAGQPACVLAGHQAWVRAVAYTADGQRVITGSYDQGVCFWNARTGELAHKLQGYTRRVDVVEFSPDGRLLVSSSFGEYVRLWEVERGRLMHTLPGPKAANRAIAFSRDGRLLACGSDDHTVRLWNVARGELVHVLHGHRGHVRNVAISPDNRYLVTGGRDRTVRIWDVVTGRLQRVMPSAMGGLRHVPLAPDSGILAYGAPDNTVRLLALGSDEVVQSLPLGTSTPTPVAFDPTGNWLACGTHDGAVWIWQMDPAAMGGSRVDGRRVQVSQDSIWRLLFSPTGQLLAANCEGRTTHVIEVASGRVCYSIPSRFGALCLAFSRDGRRLITDGADNSVLVRDAASGEVLKTLRGHSAGLTSLTTSPARDLAASSSADGTVRLWDLDAGECVAVLEPAGPYAGMNITGATGITPAQRATLLALGAVED